MLIAIIITILIATTLAYAMRSSQRGGAITPRPYNNRYSDAAAAREDHLG